MTAPGAAASGVGHDLRQMLLSPWNLPFVATALVVAWVSPWPGVLVSLVIAGEVVYLAARLLVRHSPAAGEAPHRAATEALQPPGEAEVTAARELLERLTPKIRPRFEALRMRCLEVCGEAERGTRPGAAGERHVERSLNRALWRFLRLLVSQDAVQHFLHSTNEEEINHHIELTAASLDAAHGSSDERIFRTLETRLAAAQHRLENYGKSRVHAAALDAEVDRVEDRIRALTESSESGVEAESLGRDVDSLVESLRDIERIVDELHTVTKLPADPPEPPSLLELSR